MTNNFVRAKWPAPDNVIALTTTRSGGVSAPPFDSLNLGNNCGDNEMAVNENRSRLYRALGLVREPCWLRQVHGSRVIDVQDESEIAGTGQEADASISSVAGAACAILTADCLPLFLCDLDASMVAAAHCGWRGLQSGVIASVIDAMNRDPKNLVAWLGPAIGARDYEVGDEVREAFVGPDNSFASAFQPNENQRWQADLYTIATMQLKSLGVAAIYGGNESTYAEPGRFFSYRRDGPCGRMASLIWFE